MSASFAPFSLTATAISARVRSGELTIAEVATFYLERTARYKALNTHLDASSDAIWQQVEQQTARLNAGAKLALAGVPVLVKDNICTKDFVTTCASKMLAGFRPPYDAEVISRLKAAGAVIFGKANCDEFAMGSTSESSAFGPVRNPWQQDHVAGGSSGGSAAAVAADLTPVSLGSDTGGSIRQPASYCGVLGLKPTYGRVSRHGLVAYASSLDQIGPLARSSADLALLLDVISGHDPRDATSLKTAPTTISALLDKRRGSLRGLRVGVVVELTGQGLDQATAAAMAAARRAFADLGAQVQDVSLPTLPASISAYYLIATAEASANLARFDGIRFGHRAEGAGLSLAQMVRQSRSEGFGREVKQRILLGTFALSAGYYDAYYAKAMQVRRLIAADFAQALGQVDLLLAPNAPTTAVRLGASLDDPLAMYLSDICTLGVNLAGLPALAVPCGFAAGGLPVGMQLIAAAGGEETLLTTAEVYQAAYPQPQVPPLASSEGT